MKTLNIFLSFFIFLFFFSSQAIAQSNKTLIKEYKNTLKEISNKYSSFNLNNRRNLYQSMDLLPRTVWGKLKMKYLFKNKYTIGNESNIIAFYDLDKNGVPDQFVLQSLEGVAYDKEFGFIYDLNNDNKIDYIIYYGGNAISKDNHLYYYFYHWIDTNYDGDIDALAYNIVIYPNNSKPDPNKILWIIDTHKNGKPDSVDYISSQNEKGVPLLVSDGQWNYKTLFGPQTVDSNNENYFKMYSDFLKMMNKYYK